MEQVGEEGVRIQQEGGDSQRGIILVTDEVPGEKEIFRKFWPTRNENSISIHQDHIVHQGHLAHHNGVHEDQADHPAQVLQGHHIID